MSKYPEELLCIIFSYECQDVYVLSDAIKSGLTSVISDRILCFCAEGVSLQSEEEKLNYMEC